MKNLFRLMVCALIAAAFASCDDKKSYAELLTDENMAVNSFLADHRVVSSVPSDTVFICGKDAPYYQLDEDGNIFMQVINPGTKGNKAKADQLIYFRFTRYNLFEYSNGELGAGSGNDSDLSYGSASFRFANLQSSSYVEWGAGLQYPLYFLPIDCEVNLVIKSQFGLSQEIANVVPYLYNVRYFKSQI